VLGDDRHALAEALARLAAAFGSWQVASGEINRFQRIDGAVVQRYDDGNLRPVYFHSEDLAGKVRAAKVVRAN
jgi:hypothetical protein